MFPITLPTKTTQETAMPGPLGASNRYRTAVREQFEALHKPSPDVVEAQSDSDPFKVDTKPEPARPVSQAQATRLEAATPARLPWSDPARAAARVAARAKRAERLAMYLAQGLTGNAAEERANKDAYQEITRAS